MNNFIKFEKNTVQSSIPARFEIIADYFSDRQAVKSQNHALTYRELNHLANQLAHAILEQRSQGEEPIILLCDHDVFVMIGILGILKTGKAYVPLNPNTPLIKLTQILVHIEPSLIVTDNKNLSLAQQLSQDSKKILNINQIDTSYCQNNLGLDISPTTLFSIYYTSGSTGQPKGVMRDHRMMLHRTYLETNNYSVNANDCIAQLTSSAFSASTTRIFSALLNGGTLCLGNVVEGGLSWLSTWLIKEKITVLSLPVMLFQQWLETLTLEDKFPYIRYLKPGGEFYQKNVEKARKHLSDNCFLVQELSSTEISGATQFIIDNKREITGNIVPVGYALEDKEIFLLDEKREKIGFNEVGEIAVKSRYLALGYWRNPELTQQKFLPSPDGSDERIYLTGDLGRMQPDGCLEWLGRKDFMVKIRGYRVEPSEVEGELLAINGIEQAVVVAVQDSTGEQHLAAYIVPSKTEVPEIKTIRTWLKERLSSYLIPSKFIFLEYLPTNLNGKIDRSKLPPIDWHRPELSNPFVSPTTSLESEILAIWKSVLPLERIGINDNFIELGGNSIQAMQIMARVLDALGINLSPSILLESSTVAIMSTKILQYQAEMITDGELEAILAELEQDSDPIFVG